jgi:hypothetical protein
VPVLAVGVLAAGGCGGGGSLAAQLRSWAASTNWPGTVAQLEGDLGRLGAVGAEPAGERRTVCDVLVTDALDANEQLPAPDDLLTAELSAAYGAAATAGRACYRGGAALAAVPGERRVATMDLVRAQARYDQLTTSLPAGP